MIEKGEGSKKRLCPLVEGEGQLPLPLDWTSPAENQDSVHDTTAPVGEIGDDCPACGRKLKQKKRCWSCDGCGFVRCGGGE